MSNVNSDSCMKEADVQKSQRVEGNTMRKTETKNKKVAYGHVLFFFWLMAPF